MKTTKFFLMAALALTFAACSNDDNDILNPAQTAKGEGITITATLAPKDAGATTRAVSEGTGEIVASWAVNEHIAILYEKAGTKYAADATITAVDGTTGVATISFTVEDGTPDNTECTLVYPKDAAKDDNTGVKDYADLLASQDGDLDANLDVRVGAGKIQITTPGLDVTTQPAAQFAIFKFTVKNSGASATIDVKPLTITIGTQNYVITPSSAKSTLYAALPPVSSQKVSFSATGSDSKTYVFSKDGVTFTAGNYYQSTLKMVDANAPLSGVFTVAAGKTVKFSKGNLQYTKSTSTWSFMENQYSTVETSDQNVGTDYANQDVVSFFGWGTSGWNNGNAFYQPYNTSSATTGTYTSSNGYGYGPTNGSTYNFSLTGVYANADWGACIGSGWRTLTGGTDGEWWYLFNTRSASTVNGTADARYAKAKVCNVRGVILFPDTYSHPSSVTAPVGINATDDTGWNGNNYDATAWSAMESAGCVFLPAAGYRSGTSVYNVGSIGRYWSSTHDDTNKAKYMRFQSTAVDPADSYSRRNGLSVRLVQDQQ